MAEAIYLLCTLTSLACALLLFRGYRASRARLLFWAALCFAGLAVNNLLMFVDLVIFPAHSLVLWRNFVALASLSLLLWGLVWEPS